ncbi:MAG: hypothetical protein V5A27_08385 [Halapricum sp.]
MPARIRARPHDEPVAESAHGLPATRRSRRSVPIECIPALADRLDRGVYDVRDDLHLLAEYDIVHFEEDRRAKKPYFPYDTVRIEVVSGSPRGEGSESATSA